MGKYDAVGIKIGVNFEEYSSVKNKLDALLAKFKDSQRTIELKIDIKDVDKQLKQLETTINRLSNATKGIANNMSKASKDIKNAMKQAEKVANKAEKAKAGNAKNGGNGKGKAEGKSSVAFGNEDSLRAYISKTNNELQNMLNLKIDDKVRKEIQSLNVALNNLTTGESKEGLQNFKNQLSNLKTEARSVDSMAQSIDKLQNELEEFNKEVERNGLTIPESMIAVKNSLPNEIASIGVRKGNGQEAPEVALSRTKKAIAEYMAIVMKSNAEVEKELETRGKINAEIETAKKVLLSSIDKTKNTKAGKFLDSEEVEKYRRAVDGLSASSMDELRRKVKELGIQWDGMASSAQKMASNTSFLGSMSNAIKTMSSYYVSGQMISKVTQGIRYGVESVIELDTALIDLKKVSTETDGVLNGFVGTANKMAISLGHSTTAVLNSVTEYLKVGYQFQEAQEMAKSTIIYSNVGDMDIQTATESMISTMKAFKMEAYESMDVVDKLNEVANNYAVSAGGLGEALKRSASSMSVANNTLDQTVALIAGANAVVQNESKVGNALKTISMRLRGISEDTGELIPNLRETFMLLTNNKVDIMADEDTFKSTYDIMIELGKVWDSLSDKNRAFLAELSAGKTQANVFVSIMENVKDVEKAYVDSMNSQGSAMAEQERYMESLMAKVNALKESVILFWNTLIDKDIIAQVVDGFTAIINVATKLIETLGSLPVIIGLIGGAMGAKKSLMSEDSRKTFLKAFSDAKTGFQSIREEMKKTDGVGKSTFTGLTKSISTLATGLGTATGATQVLKMALKSLGVGLGIGIAIQLVSKLVDYIVNARERMEETVETAKSNISTLNGDIETIETLSSSYEELSQSMGSLSGFQSATTDKQKEYLDISQKLLDIAPELSVAFTDEGKAIVLAGQSLDDVIAKKREMIELENQIIATNAKKMIKDDSDKHQKKIKELEAVKNRVESLQKTIDYMNDNQLTSYNDANLDDYKDALETTRGEMQKLQKEVFTLSTKMDDNVNSVLRVNEAYRGLAPSGQQAVQALIDINTSLIENDAELNKAIVSIGGLMEKFDSFDFKESNFDVDAFRDLQDELIEALRLIGLTDSEIMVLTQKLMNQYKQAWIEANKQVKDGASFLGVYNDELKKLGGEVLDYADNIGQLKTALRELDENNGLSSQTLRSLINEYPALITAIGDEEAQRRILMDAIVEQETLQENVINNILEKELEAQRQKIMLDQEWALNKQDVLREILDSTAEVYKADLTNAKNVAEAKMEIDNAYARAHKKLMSDLYGASMPKAPYKPNTVNQSKIADIDRQLSSGFITGTFGEKIPIDKATASILETQKRELQNADKAIQKQINDSNAYYKDFVDRLNSVVDGSIVLPDVSSIITGLGTVNSGSSKGSSNSNKKPSSDKNKQEAEKIFTYNGSELDEYANNLQKIIEKIDDYDKALENAYRKKEHLHDKKLYEDELALIQEIKKQEEERSQGYQNRAKEIEENNQKILQAFLEQEEFTLSKWSEAELEKIFNDKYGSKKDFKTEEEKTAWEQKAKNFQNYVRAYYDGVEAIEDLNNKLIDSHDAIVNLKMDELKVKIEIDDRKLKESSDLITNLGKELEIIQTLGGDNANRQVEVMAKIAGAETYKRQELERQITLLQQQLMLLDETDATYQTIIDRVEALQDAQYDSYINELRYKNEIKQKLMEQMEIELESQLYGSGGQQAWEDENDSKINALKDQLDLLKQQTDEKKKAEDAEKRALELQRLKDKLENLRNQKTVQQLKQNADGSWEWEYVADQEAISKLEQEIKDKEKEEEDRREEEEKRKEEQALQDQIDRLQDEARIRREAYQRMINELRKYMDNQSNIFDASGKDIEGIVDSTLDTLDKLYNGKFSSIIESIRDKAGELSGIFEDARDEAEDWYEEAVKPPPKPNKPSKPDSGGSTGGSSGGSSNDSKPETPKLTLKEAKEKAQLNEQQYLHQEMKMAIAKNLTGYQKQIRELRPKWGLDPQSGGITKKGYIEDGEWNKVKHRYGFYTGGETQGTGLHWLDGKMNKPERVLSAEQTQSFNKMVEIMPDFLRKMELFSSVAPNMGAMMQGALGGGFATSSMTGATPISGGNGQTVIVEKIELPNVTDADSFRKEMSKFLNGSFSGLSQSAKVQKSK